MMDQQTIIGVTKPHIQRSPEYDYAGWSCYGQGESVGRGTGDTIDEAYRRWQIDNAGNLYGDP